LADQGVPGAISDPYIRLFDSTSTKIGESNDWTNSTTSVSDFSTAFSAVGLSPWLSGKYPKESALLMKSINGLNSAFAFDAQSQTGICLVELYDGGGTGSGRLVALSTRNFAGSGDQLLITGFVIDGDVPMQVLVRAIGPGLVAQGVPDPLADPKLELYKIGSPTTLVDSNDNWSDNPAGVTAMRAAFTKTGDFDLTTGSKDAVLLVTLNPGVYTANASGMNNSTGEVLIEVYEVK